MISHRVFANCVKMNDVWRTKHAIFPNRPASFYHEKTSRPRGQQSLTWRSVICLYNSKLQATFGGTVETRTETKTGFCITKTPYEEIFWHSMALNCEASSPIQLKFELHWDFMPVLVASMFEEDLIENEHHLFFTTQGRVTPKWLIRSGRNSNLSEILCQSSLPVR